MFKEANDFYNLMNKRRTVRRFNSQDVSIDEINECIKAAGTAPSGANKQPWFFAVIKDQELKSKIRKAAELEEYKFYHKRQNKDWLEDLKPFKTNWQKPHLEEAAALIIIFSKNHEEDNSKCYYSKESVGIATGILITALHKIGLSTLTHTPNPMSFLNKLLQRPRNEKPFLILAVGHRNNEYALPDIQRKKLDEISKIY